MAPPESLRDRIAHASGTLSPAQTEVARLVDESPSVVAFGTVAEVADAAGTSPQTVLRLAGRLGFAGFPALQDAVRADLVALLPPAATRIRERPGADLPAEVLAADEHNLAVSLAAEPHRTAAAADALADLGRRIGVIAADAWTGVGRLLADHLGQLRAGVEQFDGPAPRVARLVADLREGDVLVALDVRRHERWILDTVAQARRAGIVVVAVSDGPTSPLLAEADHRFVVGVASPSPIESATGVVALVHRLVTEIAARLRDDARPRLDAVEAAWADRDLLAPD